MRELAGEVMGYIADVSVSVSLSIVLLLLVRPLLKKLPRIYMYALWGMVLVRMLCPVTIHGIYGIVPEPFEQLAAQTGQGWKGEHADGNATGDIKYMERELYGGMVNGFRLPEQLKQGLMQAGNGDGNAVETGQGLQRVGKTEKTGQTEMVAGQIESGRQTSGTRLRAENGRKAGSGLQTENRQKAEDRQERAVSREPVRDSGTEGVFYAAASSQNTGAAGVPVWFFALWAAGVCLCLGYELVSLFRTGWRFRDARRISGNIYTHPLAYGSFVAGILVPKIYVPEQLGDREWDYVVRHEQVHIRRRDYLVKPFAFSVFSLFWFNPLVWTAYHFMMRDMEISCDESVIRNLSPGERKNYSSLLLAMACGEGMPGQSPAFSSGEVRERIMNVSKYKKPRRFVSVLAAVSVVLCGCGIVSTPEKTEQPVPVKETKPVYVEQDMQLREGVDIKPDQYYGDHNFEYTMNPKGEFVWFQMVYKDKDDDGKNRDISFVGGTGSDGEHWTPSWAKEYKKRFPDTKYWLERYKYGADGCLYLYVAEYSMDRLTYRYKYFENSKLAMSRVKNYLFRVDEETGSMTELALPESLRAETGEERTPEGVIGGVPRLEFSVFSDGTLLLMPEGGNTGELYDGVTGNKMLDITFENRASDVYGGDGFWVYASRNQTLKKLEVKVVDEDGGFLYSIPTETEYDESRNLHMALGTKGSTILMACGEGIYEAEAGEKEFRYIAGHKTDNIYQLWPEYYGMAVNSIYKGDEEDYYIAMASRLEDDDGWAPGDMPDPWDSEKVYHYTQIEEES